MFIILSPAKKLLDFSEPYLKKTTEPRFLSHSNELVKLMKAKSAEQIAGLMRISKNLALLNYHRYQAINLDKYSKKCSYPAILFFQGDVYKGLTATQWTDDDLEFAEKHLGILSGLYGLLRPLDRIQAYRLEMGARLNNSAGEDLYDFWRDIVTDALNKQIKNQEKPLLINLASQEYCKVIDEKKLLFPLVTINFYEQKDNKIKMIGIYAKKARGLMANYLIKNRVSSVEKIKEFSDSGYQYCADSSSSIELNFLKIH
ncbi:MAG: peroxide stress protein YaaA [Tatlockia sp.]|nr:peroxide stress protein YaaA [Tatlockia sp.]